MRAVAQGRRIHVAGAGLASSPLVPTDGFLVDTSALRGVSPVPEAELGSKAKPCVRVLAGTPLMALGEALEERGLAMPALCSDGAQSIAGAVATGSYGSGTVACALADLVRSVDLVDGDGKRWRVEPSAGFTRPGTEPTGVTRLDDDERFHSVVVGVGVAGILTSLVLEVREAFDLQETRTLTSWEALSEAAGPGQLPRLTESQATEVWINPYANGGGRHTALVIVRSPVEPGAPRRPEARRGFFDSIGRILGLGLTFPGY
jgi:FAD/FMN-containing dehydrogenase